MEFTVTDMDHLAFPVGDMDAALEFYHDLLGLPIRDLDRELYDRGDLPFIALVAGGRHLHLKPAEDGEDIGTEREHLCLLLRCNDMDTREAMETCLEELRDAGVEVEEGEPRERLGAYGRDWAAYVRDPDGRRVELKFH